MLSLMLSILTFKKHSNPLSICAHICKNLVTCRRFTSTHKKNRIWMVSTTTQQCIIFVIDVSLHIVRVYVWFYRDFSYRSTFTPYHFSLEWIFYSKKKEKKFKRKMKNEKTQEKCLKSRVEEEGSVRRSLGSK